MVSHHKAIRLWIFLCRFLLKPTVLWSLCLLFSGSLQVPNWTGRQLTLGFHFLPFSSFRSSWPEEVEGPWDVESRRLTPGEQKRGSCQRTDGMSPRGLHSLLCSLLGGWWVSSHIGALFQWEPAEKGGVAKGAWPLLAVSRECSQTWRPLSRSLGWVTIPRLRRFVHELWKANLNLTLPSAEHCFGFRQSRYVAQAGIKVRTSSLCLPSACHWQCLSVLLVC